MKVSVKIEGGRATGKTRALKAMTDGMASVGFSVSDLSESGECEFGVEEYFFTADTIGERATGTTTVLTSDGVHYPFYGEIKVDRRDELWVTLSYSDAAQDEYIAMFKASEVVSVVCCETGEAK